MESDTQRNTEHDEEQPQPAALPLVRTVTIEDPVAGEPQAAPDPAQPLEVPPGTRPVVTLSGPSLEAGPAQDTDSQPEVASAEPETDSALAAAAEANDETPPEETYADEEEEEQPRLMALGVMDMDKKLGGGVPLDTLSLIEGDPEAGKSVVVQQLAYGALKEGQKVSIFLSEHTAREFLNQMSDLGMNTTDYYLVGRLSLYEANLRVDQERAERLTRKLLKFIEEDEDSDVFIVDSITPLLFQFDARYVLGFLASCKDLAALGKTVMVTLHSYAINESLRLRADSIVDAHLRLKIEELGSQVVRTLEVAKIRGAVKTIGNAVSFTVETGLGLKSIPISKTKA